MVKSGLIEENKAVFWKQWRPNALFTTQKIWGDRFESCLRNHKKYQELIQNLNCPSCCAFALLPDRRTPTYCAFNSLKYRNLLYYWGIRYTTKITEKAPAYLVNLATCILSAAEVTSHPHLGGDDNANPFRTTEALRREPHI